MDFKQYQTQVVQYADRTTVAHELVPVLGLGAHAGELLLAQQRYLCESLVAQTSRDIVVRELGMVLRWSALMAEMSGLGLEDIARANLVKVDARARRLGQPGIDAVPSATAAIDLSSYQSLAGQTDQGVTAGADPLSLSVPMLGLAGEAGTLLVEYKKKFRQDSEVHDWAEFASEELGDLLWYVVTVASHLGMSLDEVAGRDITRLIRSSPAVAALPSGPQDGFDAGFKKTERLPRRLHLQFQERTVGDKPVVTMALLDAAPNAFPDGPIPRANGKFQGFSIGEQLGDAVTDNSRRDDAYRYHDAIHLGFLAVLGWSPNLRGLLQLKRKSDEAVDESQDGARAIFAEEGLAAILAKQAPTSSYFERPSLVPEALLDLIATVVDDLEVADMPYRVWREAISQGFTVMRSLTEGRGGYVLADLDARTLTYSKFPFSI